MIFLMAIGSFVVGFFAPVVAFILLLFGISSACALAFALAVAGGIAVVKAWSDVVALAWLSALFSVGAGTFDNYMIVVLMIPWAISFAGAAILLANQGIEKHYARKGK